MYFTSEQLDAIVGESLVSLMPVSTRLERTMILVRQTFKAKFGKAGEVAAQMKEDAAVFARTVGSNHHWRLLTDLSGGFDTIVLEIEMESLAEWEKTRTQMFQNAEFRETMSRSTDMFESGNARFFTIEAQG
jgi:hypothetical protein